MLDLKTLVREFLTDKKIVGLAKIVKPLDIVKVMVRSLDIHPKDAASITLELVKGANDLEDDELEKYVGEGLPIAQPHSGNKFPVPDKLKKKKDSLEELSPMRGYPDFKKSEFPPERHRSFPQQFPYDDQTVRWSRVRGSTPKAGHNT